MPNEERKLATIEKIVNVSPIEGADRIELVKVRGWNCVAKKGEFSPGDLCVYFEVDSVLPADDDRYSFLKNSFNSRFNGYRIKTQKMRGVISQGLVLPLSQFPELQSYNVGTDVTKELNVRIYTEPISGNMTQATSKNDFPSSLVQKTDAERYQNIDFNQWRQNNESVFQGDIVYTITEKMDGTSFTVFQDINGNVRMCSRNKELDLENGESVYHYIFNKYDFPSIFKRMNTAFNTNHFIAFQGEIIGPGIQKNPYQLQDNEIRIFNVFDIPRQEHMSWLTISSLCSDLKLPVVEHVYMQGMNYVSNIHKFFVENMSTMEDYVQKKLFGESSRKNLEGYVFRPSWRFPRHTRDYLVFKVINNNYLVNE